MNTASPVPMAPAFFQMLSHVLIQNCNIVTCLLVFLNALFWRHDRTFPAASPYDVYALHEQIKQVNIHCEAQVVKFKAEVAELG